MTKLPPFYGFVLFFRIVAGAWSACNQVTKIDFGDYDYVTIKSSVQLIIERHKK